jgi:hypothetical protein
VNHHGPKNKRCTVPDYKTSAYTRTVSFALCVFRVQFQDRSAKRCRDRYLNKLDPALTTSAWTEDEDRKIVAAQARLGNRSLQAPYPVRSCSGTVDTE